MSDQVVPGLEGEAEDEVELKNEDGTSVLPPPADADDDEGDEGDGQDDDGRLSADQQDADETPEQKRERRREEKRQQRERRREYAQQDALLIQALTEQNRTLMERISGVEGAVIQSNVAQAQNAFDHWMRRRDEAWRVKARAITEGNGELVNRAEAAFREAEQNAVYYRDIVRQASEAARQRPQVADDGGINVAVKAHIETFMERNPWWDPAGRDPHSAKARDIDAQVAAAGYDMSTPDYWRELERRLRKELPPEVFGERTTRDDRGRWEPKQGRQEQAEQRQEAPPRRAGPPTGGRTEASGIRAGSRPGTVRVDAVTKQSLMEAGIWDNPERRNRVLREIAKKQNG